MKMTETAARKRFPDLVIASLEAVRKDKPSGVVTARVLFDGTHDIAIHTRTRMRDQERGLIGSDIQRVMRENRPWHFLGCQVTPGLDEYVHTVVTFGWPRRRTAVESRGSHVFCWARITMSRPKVQSTATHCSSSSSLARLAMHHCRGRKTAGGYLVVWVGFELRRKARHLGHTLALALDGHFSDAFFLARDYPSQLFPAQDLVKTVTSDGTHRHNF